MACGAQAEEAIRDYHADITVFPDATIEVTETITVNAEGNEIRRGIFRDFPLYAQDARGFRQKVDFELISVERDGQPEANHTESISGGIRIYAGSGDVLLSPGEYTYTITYRTGRQIRYFDDHDELYWNVTGNGWMFPIERAGATVTLPDNALPTKTTFFTGPSGSQEQNAREVSGSNGLEFQTTQPLGPNEGLTIVLAFDKGVVAAPSSEDTTWWFIRDNLNTIIGFGGLAIIFLYYLRSWVAVGRDPPKGVVVPRWDPPDGISPALVNYIDNKGFSGAGWTALSAAALNLAVGGYVELDDLDRSITIRRTKKTIEGKLQSGEASLMAEIPSAGDELVIDKANGKKVQSVGNRFRQAIEKEHRNKYYKGNAGYTSLGIGLSVAVVASLFIFGDLSEDAYALIFVPTFFSVFFGTFTIGLVNSFRRGRSLFSKIITVVALALIGFVALSTMALMLISMWMDLEATHQFPVLVAFGGILLVNLLFFYIMGAPTPLGRKLMDGIEGLRIYLTLAEKDRMNMAGAPTMSPSHFEKLLPYAVALGVEKPWSQAFETWLATAAAGAAAAAYSPGWYHGSNYGHFGDRIGGFSSSMASTIASTIPTPPPSSSSSSSGFSGGSSGGGGGGGGGGGW
jgi:VIT1/CCC1 family predicted Fe2+/Mn2+ transporter